MSWCSISTPPVYSTRWLCFVVASITWLLLFSCSTRLLFCSFVCLTTVGKGMSVCVAFGVVFTRQGHFSQLSPTSVTGRVTEWLTDKARQWSEWMNDTNIIMLGCGLVDRPTQLFYLDIYLLSFWWGPLWGCGTSFQWLKAGQVRSFLKLATYVYVGNRNAKNGQKKRVKTQEKSPVQMYKFKRHSWAIC